MGLATRTGKSDSWAVTAYCKYNEEFQEFKPGNWTSLKNPDQPLNCK